MQLDIEHNGKKVIASQMPKMQIKDGDEVVLSNTHGKLFIRWPQMPRKSKRWWQFWRK